MRPADEHCASLSSRRCYHALSRLSTHSEFLQLWRALMKATTPFGRVLVSRIRALHKKTGGGKLLRWLVVVAPPPRNATETAPSSRPPVAIGREIVDLIYSVFRFVRRSSAASKCAPSVAQFASNSVRMSVPAHLNPQIRSRKQAKFWLLCLRGDKFVPEEANSVP